MKQRVLVLGATGLVGKRLVTALAASDWAHPIAASRGVNTRNSTATECIRLDATDSSALDAALDGVQAVVNCVVGMPPAIVDGARVLFATSSSRRPLPRVVYLSSLAAYGSTQGVVDETSPLHGDLGAYSAAKARAEQLAAGHRSAVILRPGIIYGPGSPWWSDRIARLIVAGRLGDLGPNGNGNCNLVHVDDVVAAILASLRLDTAPGQAFNLSLDSPLTWNEYFTRYAAALSVPARQIPPWRLALELHLLGGPLKLREIAAAALGRGRWHPAPAIRPWLATLCRHDIRMNASRAERILGLRWTPLAHGLAGTADWFLRGART